LLIAFFTKLQSLKHFYFQLKAKMKAAKLESTAKSNGKERAEAKAKDVAN
jgi:hypothetical protein